MNTDLHDLTGAYATGALPADERPAMNEHLRTCPRCAQETRELLETTALLGLAAAASPPPHLRARVLAALTTTPQLPPLLSTHRAKQRPSRPLSPPARRWPLGVAACLAALALTVSTNNLLPTSTGQSSEQVQALPATPRSLTVTTAAASATVTIDAANAHMTFTARGLRQPSPGRTYQLWLLHPGGPRPAGTFAPSAGTATTVINGPGAAGTLLVTEEPAGGSRRPTTQPILALDLRQT